MYLFLLFPEIPYKILKCTWARTWEFPAGPAKINNWDLEKISPIRITVSCSAPHGASEVREIYDSTASHSGASIKTL